MCTAFSFSVRALARQQVPIAHAVATLAALQLLVIHTWLALPVLGMKKLPDGAAPVLPSEGTPGRKNAGCKGIQSCQACVTKPVGGCNTRCATEGTVF